MEEGGERQEGRPALGVGAGVAVALLALGALGDLVRALGLDVPLRRMVSVALHRPISMESHDPLVVLLDPLVMAVGCAGWLAVAAWVVWGRRWSGLAIVPLAAGVARAALLAYVLTLPVDFEAAPAWLLVWLVGLRVLNGATIAALWLVAWVMVSQARPFPASAIARIMIPASVCVVGALVVGGADGGALVGLGFLVVQVLATSAALYVAGR